MRRGVLGVLAVLGAVGTAPLQRNETRQGGNPELLHDQRHTERKVAQTRWKPLVGSAAEFPYM